MSVLKYLYLARLIMMVKSEICPGTFRVNPGHLNKRLVGHVLFDRQVDGLHPCIYDCLFLGACESFNYIKVNSSCEINNSSSVLASAGELVAEPGTIFADKTEIPPSMAGGCANHECGYYQRCYPNGNSHFCADIGCGPPPSISNGILSLDTLSTTFGGTASLTCNFGYYPKTLSIVCKASGKWEEAICVRASDCYDIKRIHTNPSSGIYAVHPWQSTKKIPVYCDMETDQGGWTVFQNRFDGSLDFFRNFSEYENGFGDLTKEYWLGLSFIQGITSQGESDLRIDLEAFSGARAFETFSSFYLAKRPDYTLHLGPTIDSLSIPTVSSRHGFRSYHNGRKFTTYDRDADIRENVNCANASHGGWWYNSCHSVNPNGEYYTSAVESNYAMNYYAFSNFRSLKSSKMMMRRK